MSLAERLTAAWYAGPPALALLRPQEWLYRTGGERKRARCLAGEGAI
jgi:tetraacyldisaccharide 4'-kinase